MGTYLAAWFNVIIGIGIPLFVLVFLLIKKRNDGRWFLLGVLGFLVSQVLIRLPLLELIQGNVSYQVFNANHPHITIFLLSVSAALFEESARYIIFFLSRKRNLNTSAAISYGIGHVGLEAAFTGINALLLIYNLPDQLLLLDGTIALAGLERISAMLAHISFSIVVYQAVKKKIRSYFILAFVMHTSYNLLIVLSLFGIPDLALEMLLFGVSISLLITFCKG